MWLRSFERFFRIKNQPLSEKETQAARPPQLVGGAAARRQRHPAHGAALHVDPHRGPGQPDPLRQVRRGLPQEGRRHRPLHREAAAPVHARRRASPCCARRSRTCTSSSWTSRSSRGSPTATFTAVGKMLYREIRRSHILALLIDKKFKPIHDRIHEPGRRRHHPRHRGARGAQAGGQGLPRALPAAALPRVRRSRRAPTRTAQEHHPHLLADHLRDAAAAGLPGAARAARRWRRTRPLYAALRLVRVLPALRAEEGHQHRAARHLGGPPAGHRARARGEQPRHPEGLLPAVGGAARPGLRRRASRGATSSRTSRPSSSSRWSCATAWPG